MISPTPNRRTPGHERIAAVERWSEPERSYPYTPPWLLDHLLRLMEAVGADQQEFLGKGRHPSTVAHRRMVWYGMRTWKGPGGAIPSYPEIAYVSGKYNHSTIIEACNRITDEQRAIMDRIVAELPAWQPSSILVAAATGRL